jgi:hypothetical protein
MLGQTVAASSQQNVVVTAAQWPNTTDVRSWFGTIWSFYLVGSSTWAAQFSVDGSGNFILFVSSAVDPSLTGLPGCQYSVLDQTKGVLFLGTDASGAFLSFPPTSGTETTVDTCFGRGGTVPLNFNWAWVIRPWHDAAGYGWEFLNDSYHSPWNNFIFRNGPINRAAVQAAAGRAVDRLSTLPDVIWVAQDGGVSSQRDAQPHTRSHRAKPSRARPSRRFQEIVARQLSVDQPNRPAKVVDTLQGHGAYMVLLLCWMALPSSARLRAYDNAVERSRVDPVPVKPHPPDRPACSWASGPRQGTRRDLAEAGSSPLSMRPLWRTAMITDPKLVATKQNAAPRER